MSSLLKGFGKGILYLFTLPVLLIVLSFYSVIGLASFIFMFVKSVILFFTGRSLHDDLPEDKKAKEILNRQVGNIQEENKEPVQDNSFSVYQPTVDPFSTRESTTDPYKAPTVEEGLFGKKEETPVEAPAPTPVEEVKAPEIEKSPVIPETPAPIEESVQHLHEINTSEEDKYKPRGSDNFLMDIDGSEFDDNDDSDDSGISFDSF